MPSDQRPLLTHLPWMIAASLCVSICGGARYGAGEVLAERYLDVGLYRTAARTLTAAGFGPSLKLFMLTLPGLIVLTGLTRSAIRRSRLTLPRPLRHALGAGKLALFGLGAGLSLTWLLIFAYGDRPFRSTADSPDVILIVLDTLRADHVGVYGRTPSPTPALDRFATDAIVFRNAYSCSSWTRPSVASILTSMLPSDHRITFESKRQVLPRDLSTLPEYLGELGYRTAAFLTNPHYKFGMEDGFDHVEYHGNMRAGEIYERVRHHMKKPEISRPLFLLVHNNDPHDAYEYREGFSRHPEDSPYRRLTGLFPAHKGSQNIRMDSEEHREKTHRLPPDALAEMVDNYDDEISYTDHHVFRFLEEQAARGMLDNTIVAVVADHGEEFLDHGGYWHGGTLYEELIRVPLILRIPEMEPREVTQRVSSADLMPTLLELVDVEGRLRPSCRGQSLVPLLRGQTWSEKPVLAVTAFRSRLKYSIIKDDVKLIRFAEGEVIGLFDLEADPGEEHDLSKERPEDLMALDRLLTERVGEAFAASPRRNRGKRRDPDLDEDTMRHLREMGYVVE